MEFRASLSRFHALREYALRAWICRWNKMFHGHLHNFFHRNFRHPCAYSCCLVNRKLIGLLSLAFVQWRENRKKGFSSWVSLFLLHNQQQITNRIVNNMKRELKCKHASTQPFEYIKSQPQFICKEIIQFGEVEQDACFHQSIDKFLHSLTHYSWEMRAMLVNCRTSALSLSLSHSSYQTFICQYLHNWSLKYAPLCLCWTIWQSLSALFGVRTIRVCLFCCISEWMPLQTSCSKFWSFKTYSVDSNIIGFVGISIVRYHRGFIRKLHFKFNKFWFSFYPLYE